MALSQDVRNGVNFVLTTSWNIRDGIKVPEPNDVALKKNGAVRLDATYAYADLANSSKLAQRAHPEVTGQIIRAYVNTAALIFKRYFGAIRSFDGDRVMAIFVGENKNALAVRASMALHWAVEQVINPALPAVWSDISHFYKMEHAIGVATGPCLITRGGVAGDNDLVSIGQAPNLAAKLSDIRDKGYAIYITENVWSTLPANLQAIEVNQSPYPGIYPARPALQGMWQPLGQHEIGGTWVYYRGSNYWWEPDF